MASSSDKWVAGSSALIGSTVRRKVLTTRYCHQRAVAMIAIVAIVAIVAVVIAVVVLLLTREECITLMFRI